MKIRYFPDTDPLYIALATDISSSEAISDNLIVDFDAHGRPVGGDVGALLADQRQQRDRDAAADHASAAACLISSGAAPMRGPVGR